MLLVSWNLAGRVRRLGEQAERLLELEADVVCLQELTMSTLPLWRERLLAAGYLTTEHPDVSTAAARSRPLFVLSACRHAVRQVRVPNVPWPERVLALELGEGTEIVNVHSPISVKPHLVKLDTHRAVYEHLAHAETRPRILCGDLNTPRREHADGTVWTFARDQYGRIRPDRGEEWDKAELLLIKGLGRHGFCDAFRSVHGYERREISWGWQGWKGGYRLDHLLVSGLTVEDCHYEHRWRKEGLSDHSALISRVKRSDRPPGAAARPRSRRWPACYRSFAQRLPICLEPSSATAIWPQEQQQNHKQKQENERADKGPARDAENEQNDDEEHE